MRVVGIANTTTIRAAGRTLEEHQPIAATSIDDAMAMLRDGKADAFALSRDSLPEFVAQFPGSRIVEGGFQQTGVAIAVPKGRPAALAYRHGVHGGGEGLRRGPPRLERAGHARILAPWRLMTSVIVPRHADVCATRWYFTAGLSTMPSAS